MIKLVAIDLDGTLLNNQRKISQKNKDALIKAKQQGVKIVLCTGRPLLGMRHFLEEIGLKDPGDYVITYNGGLVQKADTGEVLHQMTLDKTAVEEIYRVSQDIQVPMHYLDLAHVYSPTGPADAQSGYPDIMDALPFVSLEVADAPADIQVNKVLFSCESSLLDERIALLPAHFKENYTVMKSRPNLLEIMHKKVNKGTGIHALAELLGFNQSNIMTLGDEENDLDMIAYAGLGIAMGNANLKVKQIADFVTETNEQDGVARAIERFIFNPISQ